MDLPYSNSYDELVPIMPNHREKRRRVQVEDASNGSLPDFEEKRLFPKTPHPPFSEKTGNGDNDILETNSDPTETADVSQGDPNAFSEDLSYNKVQNEDPEEEAVVEDEPDWDSLGENEPVVKEQIELFLKTREIRDEADSRFAAAMDECNASMEKAKEEILQAAADIHHFHQEQLDNLEAEIKQRVVWNNQLRKQMKKDLEETRSKAQGLFSQLLMSVSQPMAFLNGSKKNGGH